MAATERISTGVEGLDEVLYGGLLPGRAYVVSGGPGTGKTIAGLHFLTRGRMDGARCLLVSLEESEAKLKQHAQALGLQAGEGDILDLSPTSEFFADGGSYDLFHPSDVEAGPVARQIVEAVESSRADRVVLDSLTQLRFLSPDPYQFRRQVLSFLRYLAERDITALVTSEATSEAPDSDVRFMADGVVQLTSDPGGRTLSVTKFRGSGYRRGAHSMRLAGKGLEVFPRLHADVHREPLAEERLPSGLLELDRMLRGGIEHGTVTMLDGPAGSGKTSLGLQFVQQMARAGHRAVVYAFEEEVETLRRRCKAVGMSLEEQIENDRIAVVQIEPLRYSLDEFGQRVRRAVESWGARMVMVDSLAGYRLSVPDPNLEGYLYTLCKYLRNMAVTTVLVGDFQDRRNEAGFDPRASYLADNILAIRDGGQAGPQRVVAVLKKRLSDFGREPCPIAINSAGVHVGPAVAGGLS